MVYPVYNEEYTLDRNTTRETLKIHMALRVTEDGHGMWWKATFREYGFPDEVSLVKLSRHLEGERFEKTLTSFKEVVEKHAIIELLLMRQLYSWLR